MNKVYPSKLGAFFKTMSSSSLRSCFCVLTCAAFNFLYAQPLPDQLERCLALNKANNLVFDVKKIEIRGLSYFYNASLIEHGDSYRLFFRVDTPHIPPFVSHIGCVELDREFNQTEKEYTIVDTGSSSSEDPRALYVGDELWLIYNDSGSHPSAHRVMHAASIDKETLEVLNVSELNIGLKPVEKNWTPFAGNLEGSEDPQLFFEYLISPQSILHLPNDSEKEIYFLQPIPSNFKNELFWPKAWGQMRGGTPARKISEDEYLAFFHSSFCDGAGVRWYIMAAYTFEAKAPYKINKVSSYPIVFEGAYDTPSYRNDLKVLFPSGFVIENRDQKEIIHVSCGENDMGVKIITLDKEALLKSLQPAVHLGRKKFHRWSS